MEEQLSYHDDTWRMYDVSNWWDDRSMNLAHDKINIDLSANIRSNYGIKSIIMDNVKHDKNLQIDSIFN